MAHENWDESAPRPRAIDGLFYLLGGSMGFFLDFASGLIELRSRLAIELLSSMFDLFGSPLRLVLQFAAGFACSFVGLLLIGLRTTHHADRGRAYK